MLKRHFLINIFITLIFCNSAFPIFAADNIDPNYVYKREFIPGGVQVIAQNGSRLYGIRYNLYDGALGNYLYSDNFGDTWLDTGTNSNIVTPLGATPNLSDGSQGPRAQIVGGLIQCNMLFVYSNTGKIWKTQDFVTWSEVSVPQRPIKTSGRPGSLTTNGLYLYYGNYNWNSTDGAHVYRSANCGTNWETVLNLNSARHVHAIGVDPYNPAHLYVSVGDGGFSQTGLWFSSQSGALSSGGSASFIQLSNNRYGIGFAFPADINFPTGTQKQGIWSRVILEGDGSVAPFLIVYNKQNLSAGIQPTEALLWPDITPVNGRSWGGSTSGIKITSEGNIFFFLLGRGMRIREMVFG